MIDMFTQKKFYMSLELIKLKPRNFELNVLP